MAMTREFTNFDYVRLEDDHFFILHGDRHPGDRIIGKPIYGPASDGEREYDGVYLTKHPPIKVSKVTRGPYEHPPWAGPFYSLPEEDVVEHRKPEDNLEQALANLSPEEQQLFDEIQHSLGDDYRASLIGSTLFGLSTDGSDLDVLVTGDDLDIDDIYGRIEEIDGLDPRERDLDVDMDALQRHAEKNDVPLSVFIHNLRTLPPEFTSERGGADTIQIIPSQQPGTWTEHYLPQTEEELYDVELGGVVTDTSHAFHMPRHYRIDSERGEIDLITYMWPYAGSFDEGDEIKLRGSLAPEADTVYITDSDEYVTPVVLSFELSTMFK